MPLPVPQPAYPANAPIAELITAEHFVVSALRLWAAPHRQPAELHPDWRGGFAAAGIDKEGIPPFDALLRIVVAATRRPLDVRCARCPHLGEDEAWMLQLMSLLQHSRCAEGESLLGIWVPPAAARMAMLPAMGFAMTLSSAGLTVPLRHGEATQVARLSTTAHAQRGLALVH